MSLEGLFLAVFTILAVNAIYCITSIVRDVRAKRWGWATAGAFGLIGINWLLGSIFFSEFWPALHEL